MSTAVLSSPDLRRLLVVGFVASTVRWLEMLAAALFAYRVTESAFVVAMLGMLRLLPMGLFGAFIGGAADRFALRSVLVLMVACSTFGTLLLAILASLDALAVWHLGVAAFVNGVCWAADNPVRRMMIGIAVGAERMRSAISYDVASNNISRILGPMLAGLLLFRYGVASVFWLGTVLFGLGLVAALQTSQGKVNLLPHHTNLVTSITEVLVWLRGDPRLLGVLVITVIYNIFGWPCTSMVPVIGTDFFRLSPRDVGLLASCEGVGGLVGALLLARSAATAYGRIYVGAVTTYFVTMAAFACAPLAQLAAVALLLNGAGAVGFSVMQATLIYCDSPVEMRARLLGVLTVCIGTGPIGFTYLGLLAEALTPRVATAALAAQGALALLLTWRYWAPVLRPAPGRAA